MATKLNLAGDDYGIFVFGKTILAKNPTIGLNFFYKVIPPTKIDLITEVNSWPKALTENTGIMFDHHRNDIANWQLQYLHFPTQALHHLANEGLADSVEFRRLARKFIRRAKQHNLKTLFFPEAIFAEPKTQQILQHLAGSQLKIQTLEPKQHAATADTRKITIHHNLKDTTFLKARAEKLMGTKLKESDFCTI